MYVLLSTYIHIFLILRVRNDQKKRIENKQKNGCKKALIKNLSPLSAAASLCPIINVYFYHIYLYAIYTVCRVHTHTHNNVGQFLN